MRSIVPLTELLISACFGSGGELLINHEHENFFHSPKCKKCTCFSVLCLNGIISLLLFTSEDVNLIHLGLLYFTSRLTNAY